VRGESGKDAAKGWMRETERAMYDGKADRDARCNYCWELDK